MPKLRVIPVVLLRDGVIVQSRFFKQYQKLGNPFIAVERISEWDSDELVYLEISRRFAEPNSGVDLLHEISRRCLVPLSFGGGIRTISDVDEKIANGADKIVINSEAIRRPEFITECAHAYGSQCVVVSIDVKRIGDNNWEVFSNSGVTSTGLESLDWAQEVVKRGAGEVLINSIDRDGSMLGYDLDLCERLIKSVEVPVIPLGGVGKWEDMVTLVNRTGATAVAAANIFHHQENSVFRARKFLLEAGLNVRKPSLTVLEKGKE
jgi:cyclase